MIINNIGNKDRTYQLNKFVDGIYLIENSNSLTISIDNGDCIIEGVGEKAYFLPCSNIEYTEETDNEKRIYFTKSLKFTVQGKETQELLDGRYYAFLKDNEENFFCVNPSVPLQVTYEYTLDENTNQTTFTLQTIDSFPLMQTQGISIEEFNEIPCAYTHNTLKAIKVNEKKYSMLGTSGVTYTNDGFKDIFYTSCTYSESFDGEQKTEALSFSFNLNQDNSIAAYNLIIYPENIYSALLYFQDGSYLPCGFSNGFSPSYTINANDESQNTISVSFSELTDNQTKEKIFNADDEINADEKTTWIFTSEYNGYECTVTNTAKYLLKKEIDANGNETGRFQCLEGYEDQFENLNIISTFTETQEFFSINCAGKFCTINSNIPQLIEFTLPQCRSYTVTCDSDWTITSSQDYSADFSISPTSGEAGKTYNVGICSLGEINSFVSYGCTLNYCNGLTQTFSLVKKGLMSNCLPLGNTYTISPNAQWLTIPTTCIATNATSTSSAVSSISITPQSILVYINTNNTGQQRTIPLSISWQNSLIGSSISIIQTQIFEKWVADGYVCREGKKYEILYQYTATTESGNYIATGVSKIGNQIDDPNHDCANIQRRWMTSTDTTCFDGDKYFIEYEEISYDGGGQWERTGESRLGAKTDDPTGECSGDITYEYQWVLTEETICGEGATSGGGLDYKTLIYKAQVYSDEVTLTMHGEYFDDIMIDGMSKGFGSGVVTHVFGDTEPHEVQVKFKQGIESLYQCFFRCSGLISIPSDLFDGCSSVTNLGLCFSDCTSIETIPQDLFSPLLSVTSLLGVFSGCLSITSLPSELLNNCPNILNITNFLGAFSYLSIESVPTGFFDHCVYATSFQELFLNCESLKTIPTYMFENCRRVTNFQSAFKNCSSLTSTCPIDNDGEAIYNRSGSGKSGYSIVTKYDDCFFGCSNMMDYSSIPSSWK